MQLSCILLPNSSSPAQNMPFLGEEVWGKSEESTALDKLLVVGAVMLSHVEVSRSRHLDSPDSFSITSNSPLSFNLKVCPVKNDRINVSSRTLNKQL